jgi:PAS domain S-box-containing protein
MRTAKIIHPFITNTARPATARTQNDDAMQYRLALLLLETADSMVVFGSDYKVVSTNKNALNVHRASRRELLGIDCRTFFTSAGGASLTAAMSELKGNQQWVGELQARRVDGHTFPADVTVKCIRLEGRSYYLLVIRDLSESKRLHQLLRQERAQRREMFSTIGNLMKAFEKEKKGLANGIYRRIETLLLPALDNIRKEPDATIRNGYLEVLKSQLIGMTQGFTEKIDGRFLNLTRTEMRVCHLVQTGYASKEVAEKMHIAFETVQVHRRNIRRKLGLNGRKVNLHAFLADKHLFREPSE